MSQLRYCLDDIPVREMVLILTRVSETVAVNREKLGKSSIQRGLAERMHFFDAVSSSYIDRKNVSVGDLIQFDAGVFPGIAAQELNDAHEVLHTRRLVASHDNWPPIGLNHPPRVEAEKSYDAASLETIVRQAVVYASDFRSKVPGGSGKVGTIHDMESQHSGSDWHDEQRIAEWLQVCAESESFPPILRVAISIDAFNQLKILAHAPWLGRQIAALLPRAFAIGDDIMSFNVGLKAISNGRCNGPDQSGRLVAFLQAFERASIWELKEHDRLLIATQTAERNVLGRRINSKMSRLLEFAIARPLVSAQTVSKALGVTSVGARDLIRDLGLKETTGRGRDRLWGLI